MKKTCAWLVTKPGGDNQVGQVELLHVFDYEMKTIQRGNEFCIGQDIYYVQAFAPLTEECSHASVYLLKDKPTV